MDPALKQLVEAASELVASVDFDCNGALIGGKFMGGNGGLLSSKTIAASDKVRRALTAITRDKNPSP